MELVQWSQCLPQPGLELEPQPELKREFDLLAAQEVEAGLGAGALWPAAPIPACTPCHTRLAGLESRPAGARRATSKDMVLDEILTREKVSFCNVMADKILILTQSEAGPPSHDVITEEEACM